MAKVRTLLDLHGELSRTDWNQPTQAANVLADVGRGRLTRIVEETLTEASPAQRARMANLSHTKATHVKYVLGPLALDERLPKVPILCAHDYSHRAAPTDYAGVMPSRDAPKIHSSVEKWHSHRYRVFLAMMLLDGYTEDIVRAPEEVSLSEGPVDPYWQPSAADFANAVTTVYTPGDIAVVQLNDVHRLRDMGNTLSFYVQGPVDRHSSTVFEDDGSLMWQPTDSQYRFPGLLSRLRQSGQ